MNLFFKTIYIIQHIFWLANGIFVFTFAVKGYFRGYLYCAFGMIVWSLLILLSREIIKKYEKK